MVQLVLGTLLPDLAPHIALSDVITAYIVQGHRFDIIERYGCYPSVYNTLLSYFLVAMWPLVLGLISATYCRKPSTRPRYF